MSKEGEEAVPPSVREGTEAVPPGVREGTEAVLPGVREGTEAVPPGVREGTEAVPSGVIMSDLLKKMAEDHIQKQLDRQSLTDVECMQGSSASDGEEEQATSEAEETSGSQRSQPKSPQNHATENDGGKTKRKDEAQVILKSLLNQPRQTRRTARQEKQEKEARNSPSRRPDSDLDVSRVIENVDRSGSFLMQLLTDPKIQNKNVAETPCKEEVGEEYKADEENRAEFSMDDGNVIVIEPQPETITMKDPCLKKEIVTMKDPGLRKEIIMMKDTVSSSSSQKSNGGESKSHECSICDRPFSKEEDLTSHLLTEHVMDAAEGQGGHSASQETPMIIQPQTLPSKRKRSIDRSSDSNFAPKIVCVSGNSQLYMENSDQSASKITKHKESMVDNAEDPSIGFVQGYLCKECGFLRKSLEDLKKHVQEEHHNPSGKEKKKVNISKPEIPKPEPPECLVCGKDSPGPEDKKFKLENIFHITGRFDRRLNSVLDDDVDACYNTYYGYICSPCIKKVRKIEMAKKVEKEMKEEYAKTRKEREKKQQEKEEEKTRSQKPQSKRKKKKTEVRKVISQKDTVDRRGSHESTDDGSRDESGTPAPIMVCLPGSSIPQLLRPKMVSVPGSEEGSYVYVASYELDDVESSNADAELWKNLEKQALAAEQLEAATKSQVYIDHAMEAEPKSPETPRSRESTENAHNESQSALRNLLGSAVCTTRSSDLSQVPKHGKPLSRSEQVPNVEKPANWSSVPIKKEKIDGGKPSSTKILPEKLREMIRSKIQAATEDQSVKGRPGRAAKLKCQKSFAHLQEEEEEVESDSEDNEATFIQKSPIKKRLYKPQNTRGKDTSEQLRGLLDGGGDAPPQIADNQSNLRNLLSAAGLKSSLGTMLSTGAKSSTADNSGGITLTELGHVTIKSEPVDESYGSQFHGITNLPDGMSLNKPGGIDPAIKNRYLLVPTKGNRLTGYRCVLCFSMFYTQDAIELHVKCHRSRNSAELRCFMCGFHNEKLPTQWRIMRHHLETSHGFHAMIFSCPCPVQDCMMLFRHQAERDAHLIKVHNQLGSTNTATHYLKPNGLFDYSCPLCGNSLQSLEALDVHVRCHNGNPKSYKCFMCDYSHPSQPGSWRFMRGHLSREHMPCDIPNEWFNYFECSRYTCRIKFCSAHGRGVHESCHDPHKDGHFQCSVCGYRINDTPFMWEPVRDHIIKFHPAVFEVPGSRYECACQQVFHTYDEFQEHILLPDI